MLFGRKGQKNRLDFVPGNKRGIVLYCEVVFRKFIKLAKLNTLYFLVSLPLFALLFFVIAPMYSWVTSLPAIIFFSTVLFNFIGSGPASVGYSYIARSFTKWESVFIAHDGFAIAKEKIKQSFLMLVADVLITIVFAIAVNYYSSTNDKLLLCMYFVVLFVFFIYLISRTFAYQIMAKYNCRLKEVIKISFIMTFAKLPMCVLISAIEYILIYYIVGRLNIVGLIIYAIVGMSFTKFPLEFYAVQVLDKVLRADE